jgi:hypothetical protein
MAARIPPDYSNAVHPSFDYPFGSSISHGPDFWVSVVTPAQARSVRSLSKDLGPDAE